MYTRIEDAASYTLERRSEKTSSGNRQLLPRVFGREFMELSFRYKICGFYLCLSFVAIFVWDESRIWPNLLNLLNFANAVRLANKAARKIECQKLG